MDELNKDLVSIIIAAYNGEKFLAAQLESIVHQSYANIEIIVLDDGSTDNTRKILDQYAAQYKNIQLHFNTTNLGYIKNFEKGCQLASGNYISFCDQDDVWEPDKTAILMQAIGNYPMVYCDDLFVNGTLESMDKKHSDLKNLSSFDNCLYFATDNCVGGHNLIMRKEIFVAAFPFPIVMPHDLWCAFIACFYGGIQYVDKPLVKWRQHENNITTSAKSKRDKIAETRKRLEFFRDACPSGFTAEKEVLTNLVASYSSFSMRNNFMRMTLFFRYKHYLLGMKKKSDFHKLLFCLKMFFKLRLHVA